MKMTQILPIVMANTTMRLMNMAINLRKLFWTNKFVRRSKLFKKLAYQEHYKVEGKTGFKPYFF